MGRSLNPGSRRPSFFKVLIGDFTEQLRIPSAFVKHFNGVVLHKCMLWNPAKRAWHVAMKKVDNNLFFQKGWGSFVQDNSLETGDFLLFRYAGNSKFYVKMYGKNCCEKDVTEATMKSNEPIQFQQFIQEESAGGQVTPMTSCSSVSEATQEASKFMSNSKHPSFKHIMRPAYLKNGYLSVSSSFVKRHMTEGTKSVKLQISNKSWPVNLLSYPRSYMLTGGWLAFTREHGLRLGDVCVFELIHRNDALLKVSIFRHIN
uniref:TF-B3 domain-containing protein n=1 Tax=Davidia involucrata TaxID=16924 RepID=A0A5B7BYF2_DAVIN